jgi:TolB-like protein/lipopolysaccharide biosynthesis regulator YciM
LIEEHRKLAAIVFTDIVGYTLTQRDEARALQLLKKHNDLLRAVLNEHQGREVKTIGDAFLLEFGSAFDATVCAIEVQQKLHEYNLTVAEADRINIRVGIHEGDVVHLGADVLGDAVNIASRIEPLAEPGGICISESVFLQVRNKIPHPFAKLSEQRLKNVEFPMNIYRVVLPSEENFTAQPQPHDLKTRIAVLPFSNISPDPNDSYFADGLTEELITVLSRVQGLRVIARTSASRYKSTNKGIAQIGGELQVGSILEGSVRKSGNRIRVTAQLIDVTSQEHLWADQYDRDLSDIFSIQTDIAKHVSDGLKVTLLYAEQKRIEKRETENAAAHVAYLKGRTFLHDRSEKAVRGAQDRFELAIKHDPNYARAYAGLSDVYDLLGEYFFAPASECLEKNRTFLRKALELDPTLPEARVSLARLYMHDYRFAEAEGEFKHAIVLIPSYATAHHWYALCLRELGRFDEALSEILRAEELDPLSPVISYHVQYSYLCRGDDEGVLKRIQKIREIDAKSPFAFLALVDYYLVKSDYEQALTSYRKLKELWPENPLLDSYLAYIYAVTGRREQAIEILNRMQSGLLTGVPVNPSEIAWIYVGLNDLDECFKWLEKAFEKKEQYFFGIIRSDPLYEKVRRDPRFNELLRSANLPLEPIN